MLLAGECCVVDMILLPGCVRKPQHNMTDGACICIYIYIIYIYIYLNLPGLQGLHAATHVKSMHLLIRFIFVVKLQMFSTQE